MENGVVKTEAVVENGGEKSEMSAVTETGTPMGEKGGVFSGSPGDKSDVMVTSWRQCCFTSMVPFSLYYGVVSLVTSAAGSYLTSQVTTIEKQFGLSSAQSGLLLSMNDVGFLVLVVFVAYFGRYSNIPRILGVCCFLYGISALICVIPYLFTDNTLGPHNASNISSNNTSSKEDRLCSLSNDPPLTEECTGDEKKFYSAAKTLAMVLISLGMFLQGVAKSPRIPLLQTYVDDNVPKTKSGFFIGIVISLAIFGPATSFGIGGYISRIYVTLEDTDLTPRDPRWVGAWWLGFLIFGILGVLLAFPVCLFPKRLTNAPPDSKPPSPAKDGTSAHMGRNLTRKLIVAIKGLLPAVRRLLTHPAYVCFLLGSALRVFSVAGIIAFTPKYLQVHYRLSILKSNLIVGSLAVGSAATGIFLSGIITRKFHMELRGLLKFVIITQVISSLVFLPGIFLVCPQPEIKNFGLSSESMSLVPLAADDQVSCSGGCNCDEVIFFPVCGSDQINYFSPCHAGCQTKEKRGYTDCLCVSNVTAQAPGPAQDPAQSPTQDATPGMCRSECSLYIVFSVLQFLSGFIGGLGAMAAALTPLRIVESRDKALAVGINSFASSLLGWFLGPFVMGYVIDSTCRLWSTSCSREGSCELYDVTDYRLKYHGIDAGVSGVYIACYILSYVFLVRGSRKNSYATQGIENGAEMNVRRSTTYVDSTPEAGVNR